MIIHSLEVESFGALRSVTIDHLAPGLNVIVGDNEAGKSTLLKALRAAFFQKHRQQSDTTRDFAPYDGAGRPQIALRFTIGGVDYALRKAFLTRPSAELSWPGGHLSGDAVEERLAELLRFSHPARQTAKTEHPGAFGLICVDQGRSPAGLDIGNGRDLLAASLEGEVGDVVGGEHGRRMLAAARALQDRFWTAGLRTRSDSPLKLAEDEAASVLAALDAKRLLYRHYQDKLERLADRRARLARYDESGAVAAAEAAADIADGGDLSANRYEKLINVKDQGQIFRVDVDTIELIEAAGDYMVIKTAANTLILRETMKDLEKRLDPRRFQRIHRSTIVNLDLVKQVKPHTNGECFLVLDSGSSVKVSRSYRDVVARFVH